MATVLPGSSSTVAAGAPTQTAAIVVPGATTTIPAAVVPAVTTTTPVAATVPAVPALPTSSTSTTPIAPIPGVSTTSSASRSLSSHVTSSIQSGSGSNVNNASNGPGGSSGNSSLKVIIPIATVACVLVIIYILYRLYLLHKGRKEQQIPLPPPRTPAIFEQRRPQSVMMMYGQQQPPTMSYNSFPGMAQSGTPRMRPVSYMYDAGQSNSSLTKAGFYNANGSGSGHSTPTAHDELSLERPFRGGVRPHSVASFGSLNGSMRGSTYGPVRNSPHGSLRGEIVLPAPLSSHSGGPGSSSMHSYSPLTGRSSRYSMFNAPTMVGGEYTDIRPSSSAEVRQPLTAPYPDLPLPRPGSSYGEPIRPRPMSAMAAPGAYLSHSLTLPTISRMADDWTERIDVAEVESNSTCTAHQHPNRAQTPPPPLPEKPRSPISPLSRTLSPAPMNSAEFGRLTRSTSPMSPLAPSVTGKTTPSSFSGHIPGAFPRSPTPTQSQRPRSVSPPEPLLNGAFVSASESAESR